MPASAYFRLRDKVKITNYRVRPGRHSNAFWPKCLGPYPIIQRSKRILLSNRRSKRKIRIVSFSWMRIGTMWDRQSKHSSKYLPNSQNLYKLHPCDSPFPPPFYGFFKCSTKIGRVREIRRRQNQNKERDERCSYMEQIHLNLLNISQKQSHFLKFCPNLTIQTHIWWILVKRVNMWKTA